MKGESNREIVFLDILLKWNHGKISVLVYGKPMYADQYIYYSSYHQASCKESVVNTLLNALFNRVYSIITNKDDMIYTRKTLEQAK